jgi:hypothetical protein
MDVAQCHRCELRFASRPELEDHLREEHPPPPDTDEPTAERDTPPTT